MPGIKRMVTGTEKKVAPKNRAVPEVILSQFPSQFKSFLPEDVRRARDLVELQFGGKQRETQRAMESLRRNLEKDVSTQRIFGKEADKRLGNVYSGLASQLQENAARTGAVFGAGQGQIGEAYSEALRTQQGAAQALQESLGGEASRLNLSPALRDPLSRLQAELSSSQSKTALSKAQALSNIIGLGSEYGGIAQQAISDAAREGASKRGGLQQEVGGAITGLQLQGAQGTNELLSQLIDIASDRGTSFRTTIEDVIGARSESERQARLDSLAEEIQRRSLSLQERELGLNTYVQTSELDLRRRQLEAEISASSDPLERMLKEAELRNINANTDKLRAGTGVDISKLSGASGVKQYLDATGANPTVATNSMRVLDTLLNEYTSSGASAWLDAHQNLGSAMQDLNISPGWEDYLRTLIDIRFGKF